LIVRNDGFIEKAVNVTVNDGGVNKGQGEFITNSEFQVNNIYNNDPGHARFEANSISNIFKDVEFADLGAWDGGADTHSTSQIYGNDGTWYARRTFDTVTLINHSAKKMIINDIMPIDRDGDPDGEVFINVNENAPSGKDPFNFRIVNQFEPTLITITSTSTADIADIQFNGEIDNPIGSTVVTSSSDILSDGSQLIRTNLATFTATDDIGLLSGNVGESITRTGIRVDLVQSTGRPENLDATAEGNIVLDVRGINRSTGGGIFTTNIGTLDAGRNVDVLLLNARDESNPPASTGSYALRIDENWNGGIDDLGLPNTNTPDPKDYIEFFKPDPVTPDKIFDYWHNTVAPLGVFGAYKADVETTYKFELVQAGRNLNGADINLVGNTGGADINIDAFTNIFGSTSGLLYVLTDGDIDLEETTGDMRLGRIKSTQGNVTLTADADGNYDIIDVESEDHLSTGNDATAEADITGLSITLTALNGYIGEPCVLLHSVDFIEIDSSFSGTGTVTATAQKDIYLDEISGNMNLGLIKSLDTDVDLHTRAGAITDGNGGINNIEAHSIDLITVGGGVGSDLDDVEIDTDNATGGATDGRLLVISTANGASNASIFITETDEALDLLGAITDKGDIRLSIPDEADAGENFVLLANGETLECVHLAEGRIQAEQDIELRVGDNVELTSMTSNFILAGRNIDIYGDWQNADANVGTVMNLRGEITSDYSSPLNTKQVGEKTRIFGHTDNDTFNYLQTKLGGDTYNYGSQFVATASAVDDGEDFFFVDRLQDLTTTRGTYADTLGHILPMRDALTLDGQDQTDEYLIVTHGSMNGNGGLGGISDYLINALDTGAPDDGVDTLTIKGSSDNDVFLLRGQNYIPGHNADRPAFAALLHGDLEADILDLGGDLAAQAADPANPYLKVERINYDQAMNGRLIVYSYAGDDYFASDDNSVITTLDGGAGNDKFQIGQLYRSEREYGNVADANDFADATAKTTRGYLSRGISAPMTIYGGTGNDSFTVYSNKAELRLEGNNGNDEFVIRAFALDTNEGNDGETLIYGGDGDDNIQYNINAPVSIDGGAGFDRVVILGTEFSDNFVITEDGIYGAGLKVKLAGNEELREVDGLEGDDNFFVLGTPFDVATRIIGGLGSDDTNAMGDVTGIVVSRDLEGWSSTIEHQVTADPTTDPFYDNLLARGVDLNIASPTAGQIVIREPDGRTVVSESALLGSQTDFYEVFLSSAPTNAVYVTVSAAKTTQEEQDGVPPGDTFLVSTDGVNWYRAITLTFNAGQSGDAFKQLVYVKAVNDTLAEGPRTAVISHSSISDDADFNFVAVRNVEVDIIDDDKVGIYIEESFSEYDNGTQVLEGALPQGIVDTYKVRLASAPTGTTVVQLNFDAAEIGLTTADVRYNAANHTITFNAANWWQAVQFTINGINDGVRENREISPITHTILSSTDSRYDDGNAATVEIAPAKLKVSIIDTNSEGVLVTESFGSTLVVQGDPVGDTYTVRLTKAPVGTVTITTIPLSLPDKDGGMVQTVFTLPTALVFNAANWWIAQEVTVTANPDFQPAEGTEYNKYFSKRPHAVSELFGPLEVLGGVGPEDRSLAEAILLPGETNSLTSDGNIVSFTGDFEPSVENTMVVELNDLQAVANADLNDDVTDLDDLVGFSLMISKGQGLDRFWRINDVQDNGDGTVTLTLENPGRLELRWNANGAPNSESEYAIMFLSENFYVDETTQIDKLNVFNDTSVADDTGTITATSVTGLGMGPEVGFDTNEDNILDLFFNSGISYATYTDNDPNTQQWYKDIEVLDVMMGRGNDTLTVDSTLQTDAVHGGLTVLHGGGNTPVAGVIGGDTINVMARNGGSPLVVFGDTSADGYRYNGQSGFKSPNAMNFAFAGRDTLDAHWSSESVTMYGGGDNDLIIGSQVGDTLAGGSGDDRIFGQGGNDHMYGDSGINIDVNTRMLVSGMNGPQVTDEAYDEDNPLIEKTGHDRSQSYGVLQLDDLTATLVDLSRIALPYWADTLDGGADLILGEGGNDIVFGDHGIIAQLWATAAAGAPQDVRVVGTGTGVFGSANELEIESRSNTKGKADTIFGNAGEDVLIGGAAGDFIDGNTGMDLIFGDNVSLDRTGHLIDPTNPRFRVLAGTAIYGQTPGVNDGESLVTNAWQVNPDGTPVWTNFRVELLDHSLADQTAGLNNFGNDYIAGGADDDQIFGQLGSDTIQGDGTISVLGFTPGAGATLAVQLKAGTVALTSYGAYRDAPSGLEGIGDLHVTASLEAATDGDDYIEGNGGNDVIFGNLGQDDIIGGTSTMFGETTPEERPDGADIIFGGAGGDISRNNSGDATVGSANSLILTANGHATDSDTIVGDNGDIHRLVGINSGIGGAYLMFNYDINRPGETSSTLRIVPRAVTLVDYTPGGIDYSAAAGSDLGGNDEIHGESGDDFVYGMVGNDILFGDGQDDDLIGGWGNDWISGGTGQDGILGDDGRIYTSRNSSGYGEALYGIGALLASDPDSKFNNGNVLNEYIYTPGSVQTATINIANELKKSVNLTPFSTQPDWTPATDEFGGNATHRNDDIIFGGLGGDFLHGGSGDDAISGAEALTAGYIQVYSNGAVIGLARSDFGRPYNPGDALNFNDLDLDGQHPKTRAGEFALYDEYNPRRIILLNDNGTANTSTVPTGKQYFLNFVTNEGVVASSTTYGNKNSDGDDAIFGDLGNDWIVGGTGKDTMYGGFGNDLLNADDDLIGSDSGLNNTTDTHPSYEDRAYGGAGRDVLIGNTGGDRLIDWVGEFNSYIVPFAPFGTATVSRTLQPQLPEFLYALSMSNGVDMTRAADTGADPARNGEPEGELGLVLQKDAAWHDQTGGPADPQAGNIPGGPRDVLRSSNFNDGAAQGFLADSGTWSVVNGRYQVAPVSLGQDAVSVFYVDQYIPNYFELSATINAVKPLAGYKANAYLIFDYQDKDNFKFAGINVSTNKLEMGYHDKTGWHVLVQQPNTTSLKTGTDYNVFLAVNGSAATLIVNNKTTLSYNFAPRIDADGTKHFANEGMVGLGAANGKAQIDNVTMQRLKPTMAYDKSADFYTVPASEVLSAPVLGTWNPVTSGTSPINGRYNVTGLNTTTGTAVDFVNVQAESNALIELQTKLQISSSASKAGFIFDAYDEANDYKFVTITQGKVEVGHRTAKGFVIDATYNLASLTTNTDYTLGVTLKGNTLSVTLNGSAVLSYAFNSSIADGKFGIYSRGGLASFDSLTARADVVAGTATATAAALSAAEAAPAGGAAVNNVSADQLQLLVEEAKLRWLATGLVSKDALDAITITFADLNTSEETALLLGQTQGNIITIDDNAAGWGWFVDLTPNDDSEFSQNPDGSWLAEADGDAFGKMDLLTAISHEIGHVIGLGHSDGDNDQAELMDSTLAAGVRGLPSAPEISYFDAGEGLFVKEDKMNTVSESSEHSNDILVVIDQFKTDVRSSLYELKDADKDENAGHAAVFSADENENLGSKLKKLIAHNESAGDDVHINALDETSIAPEISYFDTGEGLFVKEEKKNTVSESSEHSGDVLIAIDQFKTDVRNSLDELKDAEKDGNAEHSSIIWGADDSESLGSKLKKLTALLYGKGKH
jgi:Ca2+-binding RTX toxin-like protein